MKGTDKDKFFTLFSSLNNYLLWVEIEAVALEFKLKFTFFEG